MFKNIGSNLHKFGAKVALKTVEYAPQLMFAAGVVTFGVTIVMAVKAAPKINDILEEHEESIKVLHNEKETDETYTDDEFAKDIRSVYKNTIIRVVRVGAPVAAVGGVSIGLFGGSEYIVFRRLGKVSAEYIALDKTFQAYRGRVRDEEGEEKDRHYMFGTRLEKESAPMLDEEGNSEEKEVEREVGDPNGYFYTWCAETSGSYYGIELYDDVTLSNKEKEVAKILDRNGFATDNDILGVLGMYKEIKKNGTYGMLYGVNATKNTGNTFKFDIQKIWVPDYTKGQGSTLKYQIRWNREKL